MKVVAFFFSLLLIPATISAQDRVQRDQHQMHRLHRDPKSYIGALEDPKRDLYQKPQEVIMALGLNRASHRRYWSRLGLFHFPLGASRGRHGGQQQRLALARALVKEPSVLLLDEPLSNLDAKLREETRFELRELVKRLGITTLYVTHDQLEALTMSDRVTVMDQGCIVQSGTPMEIYQAPQERFVANFIGLTNFVEGRVRSTGGGNSQLGEVELARARVICVLQE